VTGKVAARNEGTETAPEILNSDPYGKGWIAEVTVEGDAQESIADLLDASAYLALVSA
jgi:glycine cleavage system H protein